MRRIVVLGLLIVLSIGIFFGLNVSSLSRNFAENVQISSSSYPSNFIDHLPFIINTTDVYYIVKDLTVNGDGITILAGNAVLIGLGHTITGNGIGNGINITTDNVAITMCNINNFSNDIQIKGSTNLIRDNKIYNNALRGIFVRASGFTNTIRNNVIVNNRYGIIIDGDNNLVYDNYFSNTNWNAGDFNVNNKWNWTNSSGHNIISGPFIGGNYWHDYTDEDTDRDGFGNTPYNTEGGGGIDYLPLVDIIPPVYSDLRVFRSFPPYTYSLSITWKDNVQVGNAILELDGVNHTDAQKIDEELGFSEYYQVEHSVTYNRLFTLSLGTHYYRWFANDTKGHWNSTELLSFNVTGIPQINSLDISPILRVTANITCEGVSNITEIMDFVNLNFKIDDDWFNMAMNYDAGTGLYSALIPVYNQLANKTLMVYVVAKDKSGNFQTSDVIIYNVPVWVKTDVNRDGIIDIVDLVLVIKYFGEHP